MKDMRILVCVLCLLVADISAQDHQQEVIGYFPSWKWTSRGGLVTPAQLPYHNLTVINYAFFAPLPDGTIAGKDIVGDSLYLHGAPESTLVGLAHRNGVKVLLSLGGWDDSDNFPRVASTPELRATFSHSCVEAVKQFGFDGIDVDWEYPGYADHKGTAADRVNFTLLLSSLRDSLTEFGRRTGRSYLLTAALPAGGDHVRNIELKKVAEILDWLNIMTYDFHGPWDSVANHNSPLYPSAGADTTRCVDASFRLYHEAYGISPSRMTIGVPFYGKAYAGCPALNAPHAGADTVNFPASGPFYYDIDPAPPGFSRYWDEQAHVPYLLDSSRNVLVSYDDEQSIRAKAGYVVAKSIRGVIIWELTGDFFPGGRTPLLDALVGTFDAAIPMRR